VVEGFPARSLLFFSEVFGKAASQRAVDGNIVRQASGGRRKDRRSVRSIWSHLPLFWRFQLTGWAAIVLLTFPLKLALAGSIPGALVLSLIRDGSSFALTLGMWGIYRKLLREQTRSRAIVLLVTGVCLMAGILQTGLFLLLHDIFPLEKEIVFIRSVEFSLFYERTAVLVCWSLLYVGIKRMRDGMQRELRLSLLESERRGAELKLLRAQMNPHFLFNALTTIEAASGKRMPDVSGMLQSLAEYFHYSLTHRNDDLVPMGEEYDALLSYLALEKARLNGSLNIDCRIDNEARKALVPGIILQPLVENAIKYGRETSLDAVHLRLYVSRAGSELQMEVSNSGHWIETGKNHRTNGGVGLENLQRRLALLYPGEHRMEITKKADRVSFQIRIPAK
jgi:sensor histidine kinase YesM